MRLSKEQSTFIEALYDELQPMLSAYAFQALQNQSCAEEAVQETFCIACAKANDCMQSPNPQGWVVNVMKNVIRNTVKTRNNQRLAAASFSATDCICRQETDVHLTGLLSEGDFALLKLVAVDRCSLDEAALEFNLSSEACKKRVQRARVKMRQSLSACV